MIKKEQFLSKVYAFLLNLPNKNHRKTKIFKKMAEFIYQEPFPIEADTTEYRLLTKDYVKVVECDGRQILKVDPKEIGRAHV